MAELFDKTILSISCLFVITLIIYILFSDNDDDDDDENASVMEGFTINEPIAVIVKEDDPFKEYATFYGTRNVTEGFSFTGEYEEEDTIIEGLRGINIGRAFRDLGNKMKSTFDPNKVKDELKNVGNKMKGGLEKAGNEIKDKLKEAGDKITNALLKPFIPLIETFKKVDRFFKSIPCRIRHFNGGFKEFGIGLKKQFDNLGKSLKLGFSDIFSLIGTLGTCGIHFLKNLGNCIFYYILEMIGHIIYTILFVFPIYVIKSITGMDMMSYVNQLWKMLYYFDSILHSVTRMHFMHYPDSIIKQCYTCDFMGKVNKINKDWKYTIPKLLNEPINHFKRSGRHFKKIVSG